MEIRNVSPPTFDGLVLEIVLSNFDLSNASHSVTTSTTGLLAELRAVNELLKKAESLAKRAERDPGIDEGLRQEIVRTFMLYDTGRAT